MTALASLSARPPLPAARIRRFDRVAITSVFGDPRDRRIWSGVTANLAHEFERLGIAVDTIHPGIGRLERLALTTAYTLRGYGHLVNGEQVLRSAPSRRRRAARVATARSQLAANDVLHTGTLDLPACDAPGDSRHYLYCDQTWSLSLRHRPDAWSYEKKAFREFERLERESLACVEHVFTFGEYVRKHIIEHYGLGPEKVTAVGSGMGQIAPHFGPKSYATPKLLFVAKHLFEAKGGVLLADAFPSVVARRPDATLTVVGDERSRGLVPQHPNITFQSYLPWQELERLFRDATLLVQPMLNDPWGQVYLEALISRTPVLGLARNGLPEIIENGRHGFLVDQAEPGHLAEAIVAALDDPYRLRCMGTSGQRHVLAKYSWEKAAERIAFV